MDIVDMEFQIQWKLMQPYMLGNVAEVGQVSCLHAPIGVGENAEHICIKTQ